VPPGAHEEKDEAMTDYLVMIYDNEAEWVTLDPAVEGEVLKQHGEFWSRNAAAMRGGARLAPSGTATSIRPDGAGGFTVTDGTFAETKEVIGGFYLIEAADLDEALAIAKQVPMPTGGVEVRPIVPTP
jgi:hypothetical protein